jgi:hypothetical protein
MLIIVADSFVEGTYSKLSIALKPVSENTFHHNE